MLGSLICLALVSLSYASTCKERLFRDAGPLVNTRSGSVVGKYTKIFDTDVAAFLGVPFAAPPTGDRRFGLPEPAPAWEGLLTAQEKPRPCMQYTYRNNTPWFPTSAPSEDCLYLNVWSPTSCCCDATRKLPVMVWIYGGGFSVGSSDLDLYDGATIAAFGEAVVVSFNYRVGAFGYLHLGGSAPGNAGMYDQVQALEWVKENIDAFGGDPDSITLFGESAGAISISLHLISPLSRGLFHRAILQSGSGYGAPFVDDPQKALFKSKSLAKMAGCANDTDYAMLQCLKGVDALDLAKAEATLISKIPTFLTPVHSDRFLPLSPKQAYESGQAARDVDVLVGLNKNEANVFLNYIVPDLFPVDHTPVLNLDLARLVVRGLFQGVPDPVLEAVWNAYFAGIADNDAHAILKAVSDSFGDFVFNCPVLFLAEKVDRAYFYWLTHRSLKNPSSEWVGVTHFDDVPFVFGRPIADAMLYTPEDGRFSGDLIQKWVSFAKTGHPLSNNKDDWPLFNATNPLVYDLNPRSQTSVPFPRRRACEFWRAILAASP